MTAVGDAMSSQARTLKNMLQTQDIVDHIEYVELAEMVTDSHISAVLEKAKNEIIALRKKEWKAR